MSGRLLQPPPPVACSKEERHILVVLTVQSEGILCNTIDGVDKGGDEDGCPLSVSEQTVSRELV